MQLEGSQMYVDYTDPQHMRAYGEADTDAMHIHIYSIVPENSSSI